MDKDWKIAAFVLVVWIVGMIFITWRHIKVRKQINQNGNNREKALFFIDQYSQAKYFLIAYRTQVHCFAECLDHFHKTGEWSIAFFDPNVEYHLKDGFLALIFEKDYYTVGKIPEGFPLDELIETGKIRMFNSRLLEEPK